LAGGAAQAIVREHRPHGERVVEITAPWEVDELLERHGLPPLPPYIERHDAPKPEDRERYQTVYATTKGSVAAPTAGLHFTPALLARLASKGVEIHRLTLHVGPGTFRPMKTPRVEEHRLEGEIAEVPAATAEAVNRAKAEGRRVVAVGTTTTRTLEWAADVSGRVRERRGEADLFIYPGYRFRVVDALVTNFHLPRSTLLLLVSALAVGKRFCAPTLTPSSPGIASTRTATPCSSCDGAGAIHPPRQRRRGAPGTHRHAAR
jgi:S-adenosylmethionine:tRNA-ribosyltransferase-isomerase (queuine synthetase)